MPVSAAEPIHPLAAIAVPGRHGADGSAPLRIALPAREIVQVQMRRGHAALVGRVMRESFGIDLPEAGQSAAAPGATALWTQPGGWLVTAPRIEEGFLATAIASALEGHATVIDQSHGRVTIALDGEPVRAVLAKGCRLDLHPRAFAPGCVAGTAIAQVNLLLHRPVEGALFELTLPATFAEPFFHWLAESAAEFGYEIA